MVEELEIASGSPELTSSTAKSLETKRRRSEKLGRWISSRHGAAPAEKVPVAIVSRDPWWSAPEESPVVRAETVAFRRSARKLSLTRVMFDFVMQTLGAIAGAAVVMVFVETYDFELISGGANSVAHGYTKGSGLGAEIVGTFVLVYTLFSATDAKRSARDSHVLILAPMPIAVFFDIDLRKLKRDLQNQSNCKKF